jgi:predicted permease
MILLIQLLHQMEKFLLILILLLIGFMLKAVKSMPVDSAKFLNLFAIYVSLPALVLLKAPDLSFTMDWLVLAIVPWILLIISAGIILLAAKHYHWSREITGALLLVVPLGNTSFLGIPMVQVFYGEAAVPYALMYDQLGSFLALAIYGSIVLAFYAQNSKTVTVNSVFYKIIIFPPFISLIIALVLNKFQLPEVYFDLLQPLAATLVPAVMLAVGLQLNLKVELDKIKPFVIGLSIKMLVAPILILLGFTILGFKGEIYTITVFEAAMPPMISAGALAIMANFSPRFTATMLAYGILLAFVTLPIWFYVLNLVL